MVKKLLLTVARRSVRASGGMGIMELAKMVYEADKGVLQR